MPLYSENEQKVLENYFTNTDRDIFGIINLPEAIKGTLFSRYSRSTKDVRRLFLDEFLDAKEISSLFTDKNKHEGVNVEKAEDFYERILVGYGDDSVAELGGVHIALENISNIAAKIVEDARIGISPLEKSTRYVYFDRRNEKGEYAFYKDPKILKSRHKKIYLELLNELFEFYSTIVRELNTYFLSVNKRDETTPESVFKASCRAKACDIARYLLPMATLTNVGLYGNGRSFEYLLIKMLASNLTEIREIGAVANTELRKVIPAFVKRSTNTRGELYQKYIHDVLKLFTSHAHKIKEEKTSIKQEVNEILLVTCDKYPIDKIIAHVLFSNTDASLNHIEEQVKKMSDVKKKTILNDLIAARKNRHHKMGRALENTNYTFEIISDIGAFRDLQRHRMLTQERQHYTTSLGYIVPKEIKEAGLEKRYNEIMIKADSVYKTISKDFPSEAQYVVPFGYRIRYYFTLNLREAVHLTELRSTPQGHPSYRYIAQEIAKAIGKKHPYFKHLFQFVDYKEYKLERLDAFKKIEEKAQKIGTHHF